MIDINITTTTATTTTTIIVAIIAPTQHRYNKIVISPMLHRQFCLELADVVNPQHLATFLRATSRNFPIKHII